MKKSDFYYELPAELIAQHPVNPRDHSKLLCYDRRKHGIFDKHFYDLPQILQKGDLLVLNSTKVLPARIYGKKISTGAAIEFLLHKRLNLKDWLVLVRPAKRLKAGDYVEFPEGLKAEVLLSGDEGEKTVRFVFEGVFEEILERIGEIPLPPYIHEKLKTPGRYQTVYAKTEGSSAAPTAGLHFTEELLQKLREKGVETTEVLLHVGLGTFRPVKSEDIAGHKIHSEYFELTPAAALTINKALDENRRVIAVGTTSVRVLESCADEFDRVKPVCRETDIFIYPPYRFKTVKGLITNFHLPESTLLMLVSAFIGREKTLELYNYAIGQRYRFFSFGDSMILL